MAYLEHLIVLLPWNTRLICIDEILARDLFQSQAVLLI